MSYMHNSTPVIPVHVTLPHCLCHLVLSLLIPPLFFYSQPFSNAFVHIHPLFAPSSVALLHIRNSFPALFQLE